MIRLVPMTDEEFEDAKRRGVPRLAAEYVRRGQWREEAALEASRKAYETFYPQGVRTPKYVFLKVVNDADGSRVGETWYSAEEQGGKVRFWVDWIGIDPEYRRRGYATQVLEQLAKEAVKRGADRMGLYVWTDNPGAVALYTKLGFVSQSLSMVKELKRPG